MELPELTKKQVETLLTDFCRDRVPPHARNQVRLVFTFDDASVTLIEERVAYDDPSRWIQGPVAKFEFQTGDKTWCLYWQDRDLNWRPYEKLRPSRTFNHLLEEVKTDPTRVFWG